MENAINIPEGFEKKLSSYTTVLFDGYCGEPVAWGFKVYGFLGEDGFSKLHSLGFEVECIGGSYPAEYVVIHKKLTREEAIKKYGQITDEVFGPRGGWKSTTFGDKKFISKKLKPQ